MSSPSRAVPNLPSRDFAATAAFYSRLGFTEVWRDPCWMVLDRGSISLEFFPHPGLDPATSWFSCSLRLDDADGFYATCLGAGVAEDAEGCPRLQPLVDQPWGARMGALIDPDGTLLRLIQG